MKLYPTCGKVVPIHTSTDKRNMNEEKQECQESVHPGPTYLTTLQSFFFFPPLFSCICLLSHRIFTLRAETGRPRWQPAALLWKRGCDCKRGHASPSRHQELNPTAALSRWGTALVHQLSARLGLSQSNPSLRQAPENHLSCPQYQGLTTPS